MNLKDYIKIRKSGKNSENSKVIDMYAHRLRQLKDSKTKKPLMVFAAVVVGAVAVLIGIQRHVYRNYAIVSSARNEDTQSSGYAQLGDGLLKYGDDGASLLSQSQKVLWNQTFEMSNPDADIYANEAVIFDKKGTLMYVFSKEKPIGPIETKFPILKAKITAQGTVATILEDGEKTWINYYAADGSTIAENQTRMENPGYPLDLAISPDGERLTVTYLSIKDGNISSHLIFYDFGEKGQNKVDNIVADFVYDNTMIPQVIYLQDDTCIAFRDNGFSVFESSGTVKEKMKNNIPTEIISTFHNEKYFGIVLKNDESEKEEYTMKVYDPSGRERISKGFSEDYQSIAFGKDKIIMFRDTRMQMYDLNGILKFDAESKEGAVKNLFQTSSQRYMAVSENGINTIKWR